MKKIMIASMIVIIMLLTLGCVSASDDNVVLASDDADIQSSSIEIEDSQLEISDDNSEIVGGQQNPVHYTGTTMTGLSSTIGSCQNGDYVYLDKDIIQDYSGSGNGFRLDVSKRITIDGQGHTIDLQGKSNAFRITATDVLLKNIIFKNGYQAGNGGAIGSTSTSSFNLENCTFINNYADKGGAIFLYGSDPCNIVDCTFINNTAITTQTGGGAIYASCPINLKGCTFTNNVAQKGGSIYLSGTGLSTIDNCNFINNAATASGAVIYAKNLNLEGCTFTNNVAENGGVYMSSGGFCHVNNCNFTSNVARLGAAIYSQDCNITNCNFVDNIADYDKDISRGGALYINGVSYLGNCKFTDNRAISSAYDTYGGAIYLKDDSYLINCNFISNTAKASGGAVYAYNTSAVTIINCNFTDNHATESYGYGGALYTYYDTNVSMSNFADNTAGKYGGAVYLCSGLCYFRNSVFVNNSVDRTNENSTGGAIYSFTHINVQMCDFTNNAASSGGAIHSSLDVSDSTFVNNVASIDGGAINCRDSSAYDFNINRVIFDSNTANRWGGSVIGHGNIDDSTFINSHASSDGGAVYLRKTGSKIENSALNNCIFNVSSSGHDGGAIFCKEGFTVSNSDFIDTSATHYGGAMRNGSAYNCNFVGCSATTNGNAIADGNAYDSIFLHCTGANQIIFRGDSQNCIFAESPALNCPDATVNQGETAILPVRILDIDGSDLNGLLVNVVIYNGGAAIDSYTVRSGSNLVLDEAYAGSYTVALSSKYITPANASLVVIASKPSPFISAPAVTTKYGNNANIVVNLVKDVPGNVKVTINGKTEKAPISNGVATYAVSGLNYGLYPVVITYGGNYKYAADSISTTFKVNKNSPITSVVANGITYGEDATVTVNLAKNVPGNVKITVNGVTVKAPISNRVATATFTGLKAKTYDVTATYGGNVNYVSQTKTTSITVAKGTPIISADAPDAVYGTASSITVNLASDVPGNVRVTINGVTEKAPIANGVATYSVPVLKCGSYDVSIAYAGNANYNAQTIRTTLNVVKADSITSVTVSDINVGGTAVINVQMANNVNGNVRITVNGVTEKVQIVNGRATLNVSGLKAGTYEVSAVYAGNANFNAQTATASFAVTKSSPGLSMSVSTSGGKTTVTANIASDAPGNVKVIVDGSTTYSAKITNGVATYVISGLSSGTHTIKVTYAGNYKYTAQSRTKTITI